MNKTFKLGAVALASALALAACKQEVKSADAASCTQTASAAASELGTPAQQASYAMGVDIGRSLKQMKDQGTEIDIKLFNEAVQTMSAVDLIARGMRDSLGRLFPVYFENGGQYNLSLSVYLQLLPALPLLTWTLPRVW